MTKLANRRIRNDRIIDDEAQRRGGLCGGCGEVLPARGYHWHHRPDELKLFNIADRRAWATVMRLKAELAKCDPLHEDCHLKGEHGH